MNFIEEAIGYALEDRRLAVRLSARERDQLAALVNRRALQALKQIQAAVEDGGLSDFACMEEIITVLEAYGMRISRHDFG